MQLVKIDRNCRLGLTQIMLRIDVIAVTDKRNQIFVLTRLRLRISVGHVTQLRSSKPDVVCHPQPTYRLSMSTYTTEQVSERLRLSVRNTQLYIQQYSAWVTPVERDRFKSYLLNEEQLLDLEATYHLAEEIELSFLQLLRIRSTDRRHLLMSYLNGQVPSGRTPQEGDVIAKGIEDLKRQNLDILKAVLQLKGTGQVTPTPATPTPAPARLSNE